MPQGCWTTPRTSATALAGRVISHCSFMSETNYGCVSRIFRSDSFRILKRADPILIRSHEFVVKIFPKHPGTFKDVQRGAYEAPATHIIKNFPKPIYFLVSRPQRDINSRHEPCAGAIFTFGTASHIKFREKPMLTWVLIAGGLWALVAFILGLALCAAARRSMPHQDHLFHNGHPDANSELAHH